MKSQKIKKGLAAALCIITVCALSACSLPHFPFGRREEEPAATQEYTPKPQQTAAQLPEYYHYDVGSFYENCDVMLNQYGLGNTDQAFQYYKDLSDDLLELDELQSVVYVKYSENVNDEYYSGEYKYMDEVVTSAADRFFTACHTMITGAYADKFRSFIKDKVYIEYYEEYEPMTEEQLELNKKENELVRQYYTQADGMMDTSCTIGGKTYTLDDALGDKGNKLYALNPDLYMEVYETCLAAYNSLVGETYLDLVDVRTKIAKSYGYDNYADYADKEIYERDYTTADLEVMKKNAKLFGRDLQAYSYGFSDYLDFSYTNIDDLVSRTGSILSSISPLAAETFEYIYGNKLYSIGNEDNRMDGGYTIYLSKSLMPYMYIKTSGTAQDALTFAHEFGHFTEFHTVPLPYPTIDSGDLDLEETHSQGLQLLFSERADDLFGKNADYIKAYNVARVSGAVIDGCIFDDWQREVYENPDMTLEEVNACFKEIELEYGTAEYPGLEYLWCDVPHNFENPMYYISYAISAFGALQIWSMSQKDYSGAVSAWESLITQGACQNDYEDVMKNAGLKTFDDSDATYQILEDTTYFLIQVYYKMR